MSLSAGAGKKCSVIFSLVGELRTHAKITSQNMFGNLEQADLTNAQFPMLNAHRKDA
jgi:hypothetical protein